VATLTGHTAAVLALAVARVNRTDVIASADADGIVRLWDADRKRAMSPVLSGHAGAVPAIAIGRLNGRDVVATGGADGTVRVWDAQTGRPVGSPLDGHTGSVNALAVGRVGDRDVIVSGGEDSTVRVWDFSDPTKTVIQDCYFPVRAAAMAETMVVFASGMALCAVSLL
jgi:WD40 repeat protein